MSADEEELTACGSLNIKTPEVLGGWPLDPLKYVPLC